MGTFTTYDFLWKSDLQAAYDAFMATSPTTEVCMPRLSLISPAPCSPVAAWLGLTTCQQ
jgi:hypothetical protein